MEATQKNGRLESPSEAQLTEMATVSALVQRAGPASQRELSPLEVAEGVLSFLIDAEGDLSLGRRSLTVPRPTDMQQMRAVLSSLLANINIAYNAPSALNVVRALCESLAFALVSVDPECVGRLEREVVFAWEKSGDRAGGQSSGDRSAVVTRIPDSKKPNEQGE